MDECITVQSTIDEASSHTSLMFSRASPKLARCNDSQIGKDVVIDRVHDNVTH